MTGSVLAAVGCVGCRPWDFGPFSIELRNRNGDSVAAEPNVRATSTPVDAGDRAILATDVDAEDRSVWVRDVRSRDETPSHPTFRWHYPNLDAIIVRSAGQPPVDLRRYIGDGDPIVAANAAIGLARGGDAAGAAQLVAVAEAPQMKTPMRCAAIEALANLREPQALWYLRKLCDRFGYRNVQRRSETYLPNIHAELVRGLARLDAEQGRQPCIEALGSPAPDVRLAALEAWSSGRLDRLPPAVVALKADPDPRIRAVVLGILTRAKHADARSVLASALRDHDLRVRSAAVTALGELGGEAAKAELEKVLDGQSERLRGEAVLALAQLGQKQIVLEAASDESWRVRMQVAQSLKRYPDADGTEVAQQLLDDPSAQVQGQVVRAVASWPIEQAGRILLTAMEKPSLSTRQAAFEDLARRWQPATEFPPQGPVPRRAEVLQDLRDRFEQRYGNALASSRIGPDKSFSATPDDLARVERLVREQDIAALIDYGPTLIDAMNLLIVHRQQAIPEAVYRQVLPRLDRPFAALDRLDTAELFPRRKAADELARLARREPLGPLALWRLNRLMATERDQLVWLSVLNAVAENPTDPAARLTYAAISHPSSEVRRRACEHLARHPHTRHTDVLLATLNDPNASVVREAVIALGATERMENTAPLRQLLHRDSETLRVEIAGVLFHMGDPEGIAALERLSYSFDPKTLARVAQIMGETADARFAPTLVRLLDGNATVRRAALDSLPLVVGRDETLDDNGQSVGTSEQVARWKEWFHRQGGL